MSNRPRRNNPNIYSLYYGPYHHTGKKKYKSRPCNSADMTDVVKSLQIKEEQIADDLNEFFLLSSLDDLSTSEEIQDGIESISQIGRELRHIHISLKKEMGDDPYAAAYADFDQILEKIRKYQKDGKVKLRTFSKKQDDDLLSTTLAAKKTIEEEQVNERKEANLTVRNSILIEEQVFREKLEFEMDKLEDDDVLSIEKGCVRFEQLLDNYFALLSRAKVAFSDDYDTECKDLFAKTITEIRKQIKTGKNRVSELNAAQKLVGQRSG